MPNVYIINKGAGHDYSSAESYGDLVYLSKGLFGRTNTGKMFRAFTEQLLDSKPDDYILLCSLTVMCSIACAIMGSLHGKLNLLIYTQGEYIERRLILPKKDE